MMGESASIMACMGYPRLYVIDKQGIIRVQANRSSNQENLMEKILRWFRSCRQNEIYPDWLNKLFGRFALLPTSKGHFLTIPCWKNA